MKTLLLIFIAALTPIALSDAAAPENINVYQVEVVVFENRLPELENAELWTSISDKTASSETNDAVKIGEKAPVDSVLSAAATALENSGRHRVLSHLLWQQSVEAKSASKPVQIASAAGELDGALRFYLSRFLLVDLNLNLRETGMATAVSEPGKEAPIYRLNEHRRVKIAEVHYFDHPKFGALVRVTPIKAAN